MTIADATKIARKSLHNKPGHCLEQSSIKAAIVEKHKETMLARGIQPLNDQAIAPSEASLRNYKALIAAEPGVSITRTATVKSHTQFTAENSLRSAMAFILTTAATHFFLTDKLNPDVAKDSKSVGTALSPGSKKFLFDTVLKANNNRPLQPLSRAFVLSTDDTTEFVFQGANGTNLSKQAFKLVSRSALSTAGTCSKFTTGNSESFNGLCAVCWQ